jgi:hypothetical protein
MPADCHVVQYRFQLGQGADRVFRIELKKPDLHLVVGAREPYPAWTRLENCQCPGCPLRGSAAAHCPAAVGLVDLVDAFKDCLSTEVAEITVTVEARAYAKRAPVQYGVSSLMGLLMATSGCPLFEKLRPMVYTHLPFATIEETMFRTVSMYLLAQYFRYQGGQVPDWDLEHLVELFEAVGQANQAFSRRLVSINPKDASLNALANLDCFALVTSFSITRDNLKELEPLFHAHLQPAAP